MIISFQFISPKTVHCSILTKVRTNKLCGTMHNICMHDVQWKFTLQLISACNKCVNQLLSSYRAISRRKQFVTGCFQQLFPGELRREVMQTAGHVAHKEANEEQICPDIRVKGTASSTQCCELQLYLVVFRLRSHLHHQMNVCAVFPHGVLKDTNEPFALTFSSRCFQYVLLLPVDFYMLIMWHKVRLMARSYQGSDVHV